MTDEITDLLMIAASAKDRAMIAVCRRALTDENDTAARKECADVLRRMRLEAQRPYSFCLDVFRRAAARRTRWTRGEGGEQT